MFSFVPRSPLVIEPHHRPAGQRQVRHDKTNAREQLIRVMLDFSDYPLRRLPAGDTIEKAFEFDQRLEAGPARREGICINSVEQFEAQREARSNGSDCHMMGSHLFGLKLGRKSGILRTIPPMRRVHLHAEALSHHSGMRLA